MRSLLRPPKEDRSRRPHPSRLPQARRLRSSYEPPGLWSPIGVISYLHGKSARSRLRQRSLTVGAQPPRSGNNGLCEAPVPSKSRSTLRWPLGDSDGMTSGLARSNTTDSNMHGYRLNYSGFVITWTLKQPAPLPAASRPMRQLASRDEYGEVEYGGLPVNAAYCNSPALATRHENLDLKRLCRQWQLGTYR